MRCSLLNRFGYIQPVKQFFNLRKPVVSYELFQWSELIKILVKLHKQYAIAHECSYYMNYQQDTILVGILEKIMYIQYDIDGSVIFQSKKMLHIIWTEFKFVFDLFTIIQITITMKSIVNQKYRVSKILIDNYHNYRYQSTLNFSI